MGSRTRSGRYGEPKRRTWTKEEVEFLQEHTDRMFVWEIAKRLKRSETSVIMKMHRMGIKGIRESTDFLTVHRVCEIMGVTYRTVKRWERHGLPVKSKGAYLHICQKDLIKFLFKNQSLWDATKVRDDHLLCMQTDLQEVFLKKKIADRKKPMRWSDYETHKLKMMYARGSSIREIADAIGRSYYAVKNKIYYMRER